MRQCDNKQRRIYLQNAGNYAMCTNYDVVWDINLHGRSSPAGCLAAWPFPGVAAVKSCKAKHHVVDERCVDVGEDYSIVCMRNNLTGCEDGLMTMARTEADSELRGAPFFHFYFHFHLVFQYVIILFNTHWIKHYVLSIIIVMIPSLPTASVTVNIILHEGALSSLPSAHLLASEVIRPMSSLI